MTFRVKFWGVRGSIACASLDHLKYGGNTSCIEVEVGERVIVLDAGTGIRNFGNELVKTDTKDISLLLTHTHWDHINGFSVFRARIPTGTLASHHGRTPDARGRD